MLPAPPLPYNPPYKSPYIYTRHGATPSKTGVLHKRNRAGHRNSTDTYIDALDTVGRTHVKTV